MDARTTPSFRNDYRCIIFFFFNDTATTEIYTLSLHDALPISRSRLTAHSSRPATVTHARETARSRRPRTRDRKSTRLNSSHMSISYAVFCLKKKKSKQYAFASVMTDTYEL